MKYYDEFYDFMQQYTDFFIDISDKEKEKMNALDSDDLVKINKILSEYQIYVKKTEIFEKRRVELFKKIGIEGKTFKSIVDMETGDNHEELEDLFYSFRQAVMSAKEYNMHALEIARDNIKATGMLEHDGISDPACYDKNGMISENQFSDIGLLNRKA